jgi:acyl-coenzyme A synthetase/AMP-(fatty) acid ligase
MEGTLDTGLVDPLANSATSIVYTGERDIMIWQKLIDMHGATIIASVPGLYRQMSREGFQSGPRSVMVFRQVKPCRFPFSTSG